jgi:DNA (cytosine-5)-methyltransferase 1
VGAGGRAAQSRPRGLDETLHTTTAKADTCLASATLIGAGGPAYSGKPKPVDVPMNAQTTENHAAVASVNMVKLRGKNVGSAVDGPLHTASASGQHHGVIAAHLAQHNGGYNETPGHPVTEPISTISQRGSQQQVVAASAVAYYGSEKDGQSVDEPARTPTTKPRIGHVESTCISPMTEEQRDGARRVAAFLRAHGVQFEGEFAMVRGYVIVDIGMRMLTPRELFRAQGFPEGYVIDQAWLIDAHTGRLQEVKLTKEEQIRMCGNSVCPPVMKALVEANVPELAAWYQGERRRAMATAAEAAAP